MNNYRAIMEAGNSLAGRLDGLGNYIRMWLASGELPAKSYILTELDAAEKSIAEIREKLDKEN